MSDYAACMTVFVSVFVTSNILLTESIYVQGGVEHGVISNVYSLKLKPPCRYILVLEDNEAPTVNHDGGQCHAHQVEPYPALGLKHIKENNCMY